MTHHPQEIGLEVFEFGMIHVSLLDGAINHSIKLKRVGRIAVRDGVQFSGKPNIVVFSEIERFHLVGHPYFAGEADLR